MLKSTAAIEEAKERGGSSVVNLFSIAGLTALATGAPFPSGAASKGVKGCHKPLDGHLRMRMGPRWYQGERCGSRGNEDSYDDYVIKATSLASNLNNNLAMSYLI